MTISWPVSGQQNTSATESSDSNLQPTGISRWACPQVSLTHARNTDVYIEDTEGKSEPDIVTAPAHLLVGSSADFSGKAEEMRRH